jgi:hypothetical protein
MQRNGVELLEKEQLHKKNWWKEKAYHQNYSCEHHMLTAQANTNIISWNL